MALATSLMPWRMASSRVLPAEGPLNSLKSRRTRKRARAPATQSERRTARPSAGAGRRAAGGAARAGWSYRAPNGAGCSTGRTRWPASAHGRVVAGQKVVPVLDEAEKTEPLGQFHAGAGPGLGRGRALAHLLLVADHPAGVVAAEAEMGRDVQAAVVDAADLAEHVQVGGARRSWKRATVSSGVQALSWSPRYSPSDRMKGG